MTQQGFGHPNRIGPIESGPAQNNRRNVSIRPYSTVRSLCPLHKGI